MSFTFDRFGRRIRFPATPRPAGQTVTPPAVAPPPVVPPPVKQPPGQQKPPKPPKPPKGVPQSLASLGLVVSGGFHNRVQQLGAAAGGTDDAVKLFDNTVSGADVLTIDTGAGGIAAGYTYIEALLYARTDEAANFSEIYLQLNNDTGANYDWQRTTGSSNVTTTSAAAADSGADFFVAGASATANIFSTARITIPNYTNTVGYKTGIISEGWGDGTTNARVDMRGFTWKNTAAVTRLRVVLAFSVTQKFKVGSRLVIYGYL